MSLDDGPTRMNWGDLTAFRAVAEELNFTRAAANLKITQPALSVRVRRLEQALGVRLLERSTRVTTLTPAGRLLSDWVERTAQGWDQVRQEIADVVTAEKEQRGPGPADPSPPQPGPPGSLDLTGLIEPRHPLGPLVRRLTGVVRRWVGVPSAQAVADRLRDGQAHLGLWCRMPFNGPVDLAGLETTLVERFRLAVELPAGHPLASAGSVEMADLAGEVWVAAAGAPERAALDRACAELGGFRPRIVLTADGESEIQRMVASGRMVALAGPPTGSGEAVVRRPVRGAPEGGVYLSWPPTTPVPVARRVLATLRDGSGTVPGQPGGNRTDVVQRLAYRSRITPQYAATF